MQMLKLLVSRDSGLKLPRRGPTGRRISKRSSKALPAVTQWLSDIFASSAQSLRTLRLLALLLCKGKRSVLRFLSRGSLARSVGRAVQSRTLLATLRRAALIAKALDRGVSMRRWSQLLWKVPVAVPADSAAPRAAVVEAHSAMSILISVMLARCAMSTDAANAARSEHRVHITHVMETWHVRRKSTQSLSLWSCVASSGAFGSNIYCFTCLIFADSIATIFDDDPSLLWSMPQWTA